MLNMFILLMMHLDSKLLHSDSSVVLNLSEDRCIFLLLLKTRFHHRRKESVLVKSHNGKCTGQVRFWK